MIYKTSERFRKIAPQRARTLLTGARRLQARNDDIVTVPRASGCAADSSIDRLLACAVAVPVSQCCFLQHSMRSIATTSPGVLSQIQGERIAGEDYVGTQIYVSFQNVSLLGFSAIEAGS